MTETSPSKTYLWCDPCRRSFTHSDAEDGDCPVCGTPMREMGKMSAVLRGLMATELVASDLRIKHRSLVRMIWTRNGMGEGYYRILEPDMPYGRFESRVTDIVCRGAEEGWITIKLPVAPPSMTTLIRSRYTTKSDSSMKCTAWWKQTARSGGDLLMRRIAFRD
ncbi:MAG: hypothetical protein R2848_09745 [Thermomicrobiales bacterium]